MELTAVLVLLLDGSRKVEARRIEAGVRRLQTGLTASIRSARQRFAMIVGEEAPESTAVPIDKPVGLSELVGHGRGERRRAVALVRFQRRDMGVGREG